MQLHTHFYKLIHVYNIVGLTFVRNISNIHLKNLVLPNVDKNLETNVKIITD